MSAFRRTRVSLFLAARSLARGNAGVTAMSITMMAAIFISVMFLPSLIAGATSGLNRQVVGTLTGGLSITSSSRAEIRDGGEYLDEIRSTAGVDAATGMRRVGNEVTHGTDEVAVGIDAVDPSSYAAVFSTPQNLIEGAWLEPDDRNGIVLGIGVAGADEPRQRTYSSSLKTVHAGDVVHVTSAGGQSHDLVVRGVYQNSFPLSDSGAFVTLAAADAWVSETDAAGQVRTAFASLDELTTALGGAATTSAALAEGMDGVVTAVGRLASGASALADGASTVDSGATRLASSAAAIASSASTLAAGGHALADALAAAATTVAEPAADASAAAAAAAGAAASDAANLAATCPQSSPAYCDAVERHLSLMQDAVRAAADSAQASRSLAVAATNAATGAARLAAGLERLAAASLELSSGTSRLADGTADVVRGPARLSSAADRLHGAARQVADGATDLAAALAEAADLTAASSADRDATLATFDALGAPPGPDSFTRVVVTTQAGADAAEVQELIASIRPDVRIQGPAQLAAAIQDQLDTFELIDRIMRVMSLLVAAITVVIITYVDLANRRRQIGIERAIGIRSAAIVGSYMIRSIVTALVGTVLGYLLFRFVLVPIVAAHPFQFPTGPVDLVIEPQVTRWNAVILVAVAAVAALIPAVRAVRMRILDAIWG